MTLRQDRNPRFPWLRRFLALQAQWLLASTFLADPICDPGLKPAGEREIAYSERGDRCEGVYIREVSGGALEIVSLATTSPNYKIARDVPLLIEWPAFGGAPVHVRSSGLRRNLYYRMDALRPATPSSYRWPSDVLSRLDLSRDDIGLLAWTDGPVSGAARSVYLPVRVTQEAPVPANPSDRQKQGSLEEYRVVLVSSVELQEVYVTLRGVENDGRPGKPIRSSSKLDQGFYPAHRPILIRIPFSELANAKTGLFALAVGAELKNGEPRIAPEIYFVHTEAGRPPPGQAGERR